MIIIVLLRLQARFDLLPQIHLQMKKESYLKMLGTGIRVPLNELEIQDCYLKEYEIQGYQITVCAKEDKFSDLIWENI